jgi:ABC-type cobalamin transport system permease subunit
MSPDSILYCIIDIFEDMLQRGYIILIIGAALLISGIAISALWAESFAGPFIRENTILNGVSIRPTGLVNTTIQVADTSRPVSLAIHVERNNNILLTQDKGKYLI